MLLKVAKRAGAFPIGPGIILAVFVILAVFADVIARYPPTEGNLADSLLPPSLGHIMGTDQVGRDVFSRIVLGTRVSLLVGVLTVGCAATIGCVFALISGYLGGVVDAVVMRLVDAMLALPFFLIALVFVAIMGPSILNVILALAIVMWAHYARVLRSEVLRIKQSGFVELAKVAGSSPTRIMVKHIFPNIVNTLAILATLNIGFAIIGEASLSFLGMGVPPPYPAWGRMLSDGRIFMDRAWWLSVFPGLAILLVVLTFNLLGDWLRDYLDPKTRHALR